MFLRNPAAHLYNTEVYVRSAPYFLSIKVGTHPLAGSAMATTAALKSHWRKVSSTDNLQVRSHCCTITVELSHHLYGRNPIVCAHLGLDAPCITGVQHRC